MPPGRDEGRKLLENLPMFAGLGKPTLDALVRQAVFVPVRRGQQIVSHADATTDVFIILAGHARIEIHAPDGKLVTLRDVHAGEIVGELSAIDGAPRSASVTATGPGEIARFAAPVFMQILLSDRLLTERVMQYLAGKIREMTNRVFEFGALDVPDRILCELWRLTARGEETPDGILIHPAPTHEIIAHHVASHREAVTRTLSALQAQGILKRGRERLLIRKPELLQERVERALGYPVKNGH